MQIRFPRLLLANRDELSKGNTVKSGIRTPAKGLKGPLNRLLAKNLERVLAIPGSKLLKEFENASRNVEETQLSVLREILAYSADTVVGR